MQELDKILDNNEKVLWEGKPKFWPYLISGSLITTIFGFIWMIFMIPFLFIAFMNIAQGGFIVWGILLLPHLWVGPILVFGIPIYQILVYNHVFYAITNKRVILQNGLIGRDFIIVDFDQITNAEVNVNIFDKLAGGDSGSILISTAGSFTNRKNGAVHKPYTLRNIEIPYEVFKFFKKVSHAVKTDIHYPNKYRPKSNPGYETEYMPKK